MAKLEAAIAARQQTEEESRLKREQEKEATIRSQQKEKVRLSPSLPSQSVNFILQHLLNMNAYVYECEHAKRCVLLKPKSLWGKYGQTKLY